MLVYILSYFLDFIVLNSDSVSHSVTQPFNKLFVSANVLTILRTFKFCFFSSSFS